MTENRHSLKTHKMPRWTESEVAVLREHPDMTASELSSLLPGRTPDAVENARRRYGRWDKGAQRMCVCCDSRPVWRESPKARRLRLCKGCYLDEMQMRSDDELRANAVRQRVHKAKVRGSR